VELSIDVLVITYNQGKYISDCIESILCQECELPFRILVSDDNSTDDTFAVLQEYQKNYPHRIVLLANRANQGVSRNFEKVIRASAAPLIAFCEGDDFWCDSHKLQKQLIAFRNEPLISFVYSDFHRCNSFNGTQYIFRDSAKSVGDPPISGRIFDKLLNGVNIHLSTILCRRSLALQFLDSPVFNRDSLLADVPLFLFLAAYGCAIGIKESLSVYRQNQGSITNASLASRLRIQVEHLCYLHAFDKYYSNSGIEKRGKFASQVAAISCTAYQARRPLTFMRYQSKYSMKSLLRLMLILVPFLHSFCLKRAHRKQFDCLIKSSAPVSISHNPFRLEFLV
jgi:glycosyltransferase involved in cell wall biosynthesis